MSATNSTANYNLPVFLATDKPAWLTDWNGAMNAIDTAIHTAHATADGAQTTAGTATADIATINASLSTITSNISSLTTTVNGNTGSINTINSLIGNGEPTTEDKTIIGAINEIYAMIGGGTELLAENVSFDGTVSSLTADNVQDAIDEVVAMIPGPGPTPTPGADLNFVTRDSFTVTASVGTLHTSDVRLLLNTDKTIGKVYGGVEIRDINSSSTGLTTVATLSSSELTVISEAFNIFLGFMPIRHATGAVWGYYPARLHFNTNGTVEVQIEDLTGIDRVIVNLPACVYVLKDLGD